MKTKLITKHIRILKLESGMKLLEPILDSDGRILIQTNTELNDKSVKVIRNLSNYEYKRIKVEMLIEILEEHEKQIIDLEKKIIKKFSDYEDKKIYMFIRNLCIQSVLHLEKIKRKKNE